MEIMDKYNEINSIAEGLFKDKGSKFICKVYPVYNEDQIKIILNDLRKEYYDARHFCYSYILNHDKSVYRINDDGEPSGSAGKPIHGQLLSFDVTNILAVVIRYFGGTKLGVPGLINAYRTATKEALSSAKIVKKTLKDVYGLNFEYPLMNVVMRFLKDEDLEQILTKFEISCYIEVAVRKGDSERIKKLFDNIYGLKSKLLRTE